MREIVMGTLAGFGAGLLARNLQVILLMLPEEVRQGHIWRIIHFHVPAAMVAALCAVTAFVASVLYLKSRNLRYDALAVAATEVGLAFGAANLITGMIWARNQWGVWWAWDARLTSMLVVWLMYAGYMMFRRAVEEPTERARTSAVLSIFIAPGMYITWKSIVWWRTLHPDPVLSVRGAGGKMAPAMEQAMFWNLLALATLAAVMVMLRLRQEERRRELDALRRRVHAF